MAVARLWTTASLLASQPPRIDFEEKLKCMEKVEKPYTRDYLFEVSRQLARELTSFVGKLKHAPPLKKKQGTCSGMFLYSSHAKKPDLF